MQNKLEHNVHHKLFSSLVEKKFQKAMKDIWGALLQEGYKIIWKAKDIIVPR